MSKRTETAWIPRALSRVHAALYLDLSPGTFDTLVKAGRLPQPRTFTVTENARPMRRWDRVALDAAFEELGEVEEAPVNPWDR
jgi:hypothetical protein